LNKQLYQACKLASVGELASGVAHEINNPLAIILTEAQVIRDVEEDTANLDLEFKSQLDESLDQIETQVQRCNLITQNLLRFSHRTRSLIERVDLNRFLQEVIDLMHKKAQTSGIQLSGNFEENLPPLQSDPSQLPAGLFEPHQQRHRGPRRQALWDGSNHHADASGTGGGGNHCGGHRSRDHSGKHRKDL